MGGPTGCLVGGSPWGDEWSSPEPTEPKDEMWWLPTSMLREPLLRLPLDSPPMVSDLALLSPPRCGKEREAGGGRGRGGARAVALGRKRVVDFDGDQVVAVPKKLHGHVASKGQIETRPRAVVFWNDGKKDPLPDGGRRISSLVVMTE